MEHTAVTYLDYYIPREQLPVADLIASIAEGHLPASFEGKEDYAAFVADVLELDAVMVETGMDGAGMIHGLLQKLFDSGFPPGAVDLIVVVQDTREERINNSGHYFQHAFHMSSANILQMGGNHCCNMEVSLRYILRLMDSDPTLKNVLFIGYLKHLRGEDRIIGSYAIEGDGAGIMMVQKGGAGWSMPAAHMLTNGALYAADMNADNSLLHCKYYVKCLRELLQRNHLTGRDIGGVIIQNANKLLTEQCLAAAGIDPGAIFLGNYGRYGHLDCLDFIVNLKDIGALGVQPGSRWLSFGTGWAGTYISSLLIAG
jgi:3-oxoacyl-[acyl-carrier-protein] synthase III